jgi:hypothetical protein
VQQTLAGTAHVPPHAIVPGVQGRPPSGGWHSEPRSPAPGSNELLLVITGLLLGRTDTLVVPTDTLLVPVGEVVGLLLPDVEAGSDVDLLARAELVEATEDPTREEWLPEEEVVVAPDELMPRCSVVAAPPQSMDAKPMMIARLTPHIASALPPGMAACMTSGASDAVGIPGRYAVACRSGARSSLRCLHGLMQASGVTDQRASPKCAGRDAHGGREARRWARGYHAT